ncbi:MAG: hypothetical protein ACKV2U_21355 [Bryobacteraceae bacterium]
MQKLAREHKNLKTEIEIVARALIGLDVCILRWAGNMRIIHFGDVHKRRGSYIGEYALHIHCPWRLEGRAKMLTGFHDIYEPATTNINSDWTPEKGGRGSLQQEILEAEFKLEPDQKPKSLATKAKRRIVSSIAGDHFGGLVVSFSGGVRIRIFPASATGEQWRLFRPGIKTARHFVVDSGNFSYD